MKESRRKFTIEGNWIRLDDHAINGLNLTSVRNVEIETDRKGRRNAGLWGFALMALGTAATQVSTIMTLSAPIHDFTSRYWVIPTTIGLLGIIYFFLRRSRYGLILSTSDGRETVLMSRDRKFIGIAAEAVRRAGSKNPPEQKVTFDFSNNQIVNSKTGDTINRSNFVANNFSGAEINQTGNGSSVGAGTVNVTSL